MVAKLCTIFLIRNKCNEKCWLSESNEKQVGEDVLINASVGYL